jgi:hypothetical protein
MEENDQQKIGTRFVLLTALAAFKVILALVGPSGLSLIFLLVSHHSGYVIMLLAGVIVLIFSVILLILVLKEWKTPKPLQLTERKMIKSFLVTCAIA